MPLGPGYVRCSVVPPGKSKQHDQETDLAQLLETGPIILATDYGTSVCVPKLPRRLQTSPPSPLLLRIGNIVLDQR